MNANEFTFGIEIETVAPDSAIRDHALRIGAYKRGVQVPYLPTGWKAESDGSIDNSAGGHKCEIVSPVLRGEEGLAQVAEVLRVLEEKGHRVTASCGVHVHVGWRGLSGKTVAGWRRGPNMANKWQAGAGPALPTGPPVGPDAGRWWSGLYI